jgi:hypothetical protein
LTPLDRERALILRLARSTAPLAGADLEQVDFETLRSELRRLKLLGLLGSRLLDQAPPGSVTPEFTDEVREILRRGAFDSMRKQLITQRLWRELERAGIPAIPLKGPFLSRRLHGDAAFRLSHDIDLLVARHHLRPAIDAIQRAGFVWRPGRSTPVLHHLLESKDDVPVELHWRVSWYENEYAGDVMGRSFVADDVRRPALTDDLAILLLVHARDGLSGLRTAVDVAAWWDLYPGAVSAPELEGLMAAHPALRRPLTAAAVAAEEVLEVPIASTLLPAVRVGRRTRAAIALADWLGAGNDASRDASTKVVDGLLTEWRGAGSYVRRAMFPRLPGNPRSEAARRGLYAASLSRRAVPLVTRGFIRSSPHGRSGRHPPPRR